MTLRDTIRSFLERVLVWAKRNREVWGERKTFYETRYKSEKDVVDYRMSRFLKKIGLR